LIYIKRHLDLHQNDRCQLHGRRKLRTRNSREHLKRAGQEGRVGAAEAGLADGGRWGGGSGWPVAAAGIAAGRAWGNQCWAWNGFQWVHTCNQRSSNWW
jgi:hypothetical protein